jgi:penicillin-binding protein activator
MKMQKISPLLLAFSLLIPACAGTKVVRDSDVKGLDDAALGTGLDRTDLERLLHANMQSLLESPLSQRWQNTERPSVAVLPLRNETSEHIESALETLLSDVETELVNDGRLRVISTQDQPELMSLVREQHSDAFDPTQVASWGKQVGARYFVTGKVYTVDERQGRKERRVQYFLFMRLLDAATGDLLWQNKASVTKAIVRD